MQNLLLFLLFCFSNTQLALDAFPTEEMPVSGSPKARDFDYRMESDYVVSDTTTESENKTGIISSVWQKLSNIFGAETTTEIEPEVRKEELTPDKPKLPWKSGEMYRGRARESKQRKIIPVDFSKQSKDGRLQRETYDEGNFYPVHRLVKKSLYGSLYVNDGEGAHARKRKSIRDNAIKYVTERPTDSADKTVPVVVEEFDQGETVEGRIKRFKDSSESTDWGAEKIVVGSDPVESIDNTNYIEETKNLDFPFHAYSVEPIIVEDSFTDEMTALSERELPPLKIIEY